MTLKLMALKTTAIVLVLFQFGALVLAAYLHVQAKALTQDSWLCLAVFALMSPLVISATRAVQREAQRKAPHDK